MWINSDLSECRGIYERDLRKRQEEHLDHVRHRLERPWQPCMHNGCSECAGTGIKRNGTPCIHTISCPCPRCNPTSM